MASDRAFRIPRAQQDRLHARQLVAIAATCMSVGVALSGVLAAKHQPDERGLAWQSAAAGPALPSWEGAVFDPPAVAQASSETSISAATSAPVARVSAAPNQQHVGAAPAKNPGKTTKTSLVRGAVTYRCEGAAKACPHDRALEARVWRVLARLASCRASADAFGNAVLKLWFGPSSATRVVFAAPTIAPSLNLRAVSQCVARDLSRLRATRKADRFELSLGFGWAARN